VRRPVSHPRFSGPVWADVEARTSDDDEQTTGQTVERMRQYAAADATSPAVRAAAAAALAEHPELEPPAAVWHWIKRHVRLVRDSDLARDLAGVPDDAEILVRPVDLLGMPEPAGDCDDWAMLAAAMLRALSIPARFRTVAEEQNGPYSHVYVIARYGGREIPLDSHGPYPGWEARTAGKRRDWATRSTDTMGDLGISEFWKELLRTGAGTGLDIAKARYGQPPAGTFIQQTDQGRLFYRQPEHAPPYTFPGGAIDIGTPVGPTNLVLILGTVLLGAVVLMSLRK